MEDAIATKKGGSPLWCRALKMILWVVLGLWGILIVVAQVALSSSFLEGMAGKIASEYVDGTVTFSRIKASMFRSFPNLNVSVEDFSITYPHERFASFDSLIPPGADLHPAGWGSPDTLAHFDRLSLSVNYMKAIRGRISVGHAVLEHPRIFLHRFDSTTANWDIIRLPEDSPEDTSSFNLPPLSVGKISLEKSPLAVYTSLSDTLGAALDLDHLTLKSHRNHYDISLSSVARLQMNGIGVMNLPLKAEAKFTPDFGKRIYSVSGLKLSLATIDMTADGMADLGGENIRIKADAAIDEEPLGEVAEYFGDNIPVLRKLRTDARLSLDAHCDGEYVNATGSLPPLTVHISVPEAFIGWEGIGERGFFDLEATATSMGGGLSAQISDLCLRIDGAAVSLSGSLEDLLADDPLLRIDSRIHARLDSLLRFLPDSLGISALGGLDGNLKGSIKLSQLDPGKFLESGLEGSLKSDGIRIDAPKDSLSAFLGKTSIHLGKSDNGHEEENLSGSAIWATVDSLFAEYGVSTFIRGTALRLSAHNSEEKVSASPGQHSLHGHLDIESIGMMDLDSCFVGIKGSSNVFKLTMMPGGRAKIPYMSLSSENKAIAVRESVNRITLGGVNLSVNAHPGAAEAKDRRARLLDSLQRVYPGVARDSLLRRAFSRMRDGKLPDYLSEKDFEKKDIRISLGESVGALLKEWDITGGFKIREGAVITPYFPLENKISDLSGNFTNNRIDLKSLKVNSGSSDLRVKGYLSGLKRLLTSGKGRLTLDADISSERIDLDELLVAAGAGSQYTPPGENTAFAVVDDSSYLGAIKQEALADSIPASPLIVLPANLNARIGIQAGTVRYSDLETSFVSTDLVMKERCLQVTNTLAMTNMGEVFMEGFYSTRTKKDLKAGFDLMLSNITAEKVIQLFPAVDSIMPMLKAFKGLLDCEIAATSSIDTSMNIVLPSLSGMIKIDGKHLSLAESEDLDKLRKTLMFKDRDSSYIDAMSVRGVVKDNQLEVFPFILKVDRYTLALNGIQHFDQKFKYHVAALRSPIPFRFGVNLNGSFSDWRWHLGKAKFKSTKIPLFDDQIDGLRLNLVGSIHSIFDHGVEQAMLRNEKSQEAIEEKKAEVSYSADQTEDLSDIERKTIEALEKVTGAASKTEGEVKEGG